MGLSEYFKHITSERLERLREAAANRSRYYTFVFDNFFDPHNISAGIRSIEAFGFQDVHIITGTNPFKINKSISRGCSKWLDVKLYDDVGACFKYLKNEGYTILVADPNENGLTIDDMGSAGRSAFVFGQELYGISDEARALSDGSFRIRMRGYVESFNVSVSVALAAFAARRHCEQNIPEEDWLFSAAERDALVEKWLLKNTVIGKISGGKI